MFKFILWLALGLASTVSVAQADPVGFEVNIEITAEENIYNSTVTVEEGVQGTLTSRDDKGNVIREVKLKVDVVSESTALLSLIITEASKQVSESRMELTYGATGSMNQSTPTGSRTLKATIQRLTTEQLNDLKVSVGVAPSCGADTDRPVNLTAPQQPLSGCCGIRCPWGGWTTCCNVVRCCDCGGCCSPASGCPGGPCP